MPRSTIASITAKLRVVTSKKRIMNRNQTTSRASRMDPEQNAPRSTLATPFRAGTAVSTSASSTRGRAVVDEEGAPLRSRKDQASPAARKLHEAATAPAPLRPSHFTKNSSVIRTPATAPSVFHP
jgi:hypothetical protein